jgi:error-prone DNA polymerase
MRHLRDRLRELGVLSAAELRRPGMRHGQRVKAAGLVIARQRPGTAKGFVFLGMEDETGRLDVIVSPKLYARQRDTINSHGILAVQGRLGTEEGVVNLRAERFFPLTMEVNKVLVPAHDYR